jgi:hypothetical protein
MRFRSAWSSGIRPVRANHVRTSGVPARGLAGHAFAASTKRTAELHAFSRSPLTDSNRRPPPYHQGSRGCRGLRTVADRRVLAVLVGAPFASGCHGLRPLCSTNAPYPSGARPWRRGRSLRRSGGLRVARGASYAGFGVDAVEVGAHGSMRNEECGARRSGVSHERHRFERPTWFEPSCISSSPSSCLARSPRPASVPSL